MACLLFPCPNIQEAVDKKLQEDYLSPIEVLSGMSSGELSTSVGSFVVSCCAPQAPTYSKIKNSSKGFPENL